MKKCPNCGKEFQKQGHLNLHKYHCDIKQAKKNAGEPEEEKKNAACVHNWRLLNLKIPVEKNAYEQGNFTEVCTKCQDLQ